MNTLSTPAGSAVLFSKSCITPAGTRRNVPAGALTWWPPTRKVIVLRPRRTVPHWLHGNARQARNYAEPPTRQRRCSGPQTPRHPQGRRFALDRSETDGLLLAAAESRQAASSSSMTSRWLAVFVEVDVCLCLTGAPIHHVTPFRSMTPPFRCPYGLSSGSLSDRRSRLKGSCIRGVDVLHPQVQRRRARVPGSARLTEIDSMNESSGGLGIR